MNLTTARQQIALQKNDMIRLFLGGACIYLLVVMQRIGIPTRITRPCTCSHLAKAEKVVPLCESARIDKLFNFSSVGVSLLTLFCIYISLILFSSPGTEQMAQDEMVSPADSTAPDEVSPELRQRLQHMRRRQQQQQVRDQARRNHNHEASSSTAEFAVIGVLFLLLVAGAVYAAIYMSAGLLWSVLSVVFSLSVFCMSFGILSDPACIRTARYDGWETYRRHARSNSRPT